jgi:hypothetical protein
MRSAHLLDDRAFLLFVLVGGFADTEVFDISWPMWLTVLFGAFVSEQQTQEAMA